LRTNPCLIQLSIGDITQINNRLAVLCYFQGIYPLRPVQDSLLATK
jgi:hypothetical protein